MLSFYKTTIGKKFIVAITGLLMVLFVVGHAAGNLKAFGGYSDGQHMLDHYGELLRSIGTDFLGHGTALWIVRIGLLLTVVLHIVTVIQLQVINKRNKPEQYLNQKYRAATIPARIMFYGGILLLIFIVFHILHFTVGTVHFDGFVHGKVYQNVYNAFKHWYLVLFYVVSMFFLMLHLDHGIWSMFQTLGLDSPTRNKKIRLGASVLSLVVFIIFISVPLAVFFNLVAPPAGGF